MALRTQRICKQTVDTVMILLLSQSNFTNNEKFCQAGWPADLTRDRYETPEMGVDTSRVK